LKKIGRNISDDVAVTLFKKFRADAENVQNKIAMLQWSNSIESGMYK
jgi:hypothetical protein